MSLLFIKFKDISLYCDEEVLLELDKYLNMLGDINQRVIIEERLEADFAIICNEYVDESEFQSLRAEICKTWIDSHPEDLNIYDIKQKNMFMLIDNAEMFQDKIRSVIERQVCLQKMMSYIGANLGSTHSKLQCEMAIKMFRANNFKKLNRFDRILLDNLQKYDKSTISLILKYRFSDRFRAQSSSRNTLCHSKSLVYVLTELKLLYPDVNELKILECMMYYGDLFVVYDCDEEFRAVQACKLLSKNNLDFFALTFDVFMVKDERVIANDLFKYAQQIDSLSARYGVNWKYFFYNKIPNINELQNLIFVLSLNVKVSEFNGGIDPMLQLEYSMWCIDGFAIEDYVKKGYRNIEQLRFIRYILRSNKDPDDYAIAPDMTLEETKVCYEMSSVGNEMSARRRKYIDRGNDWYSIHRPSKR